MNSYESMIVISANLQESDVQLVNKSITDFIKEIGGELIETEEWGKKVLAYEILKQKEGYYFVNYFKLAADKMLDLDRQYRLNENIIRHNIIKK
jgi:small subunit ribosomal protein S6